MLFFKRFLLITLLSCFLYMPSQAQSPNSLHLAAYSQEAYKAKELHGALEIRVVGNNEHRVMLFVPSQPRLQGEAPIVFFHHGWNGMNPFNFGSLIDHLVRSGHVVIFPVYQNGEKTSPLDITDHAGFANRLALDTLAKEFSLVPMEGSTLYYGFSIGSAISVNLALDPQRFSLPPANAMFLVAPGDAYHVNQGRYAQSIYGTLEQLPTTLPVVIMTGEDDEIGLPTARKLAARLCHIPRSHRILYVMPSSSHGARRVVAGHGSPGAPDSRYNFPLGHRQFPPQLTGLNHYEESISLNQLDFFGYWKMLDGLLEGLKSGGAYSEVVFGTGTPEQLSLGVWPDGIPLNPLKIEDVCD